VETGKLRWATYCFDPYDRHNLFKLVLDIAVVLQKEMTELQVDDILDDKAYRLEQ